MHTAARRHEWTEAQPLIRLPLNGADTAPFVGARARLLAPSRTQALTLLGDVGVLLASYVAVAELFDLDGGQPARLVLWTGVLVCLWLGVAMNQGVYSAGAIRHLIQGPYTGAKCTVVAGALFHVVPLVGGPVNSRITSFGVVALLVVGVVAWRLVLARLLARTRTLEDVVIVGTGWAGHTLAASIATTPGSNLRVLGFINTDVTDRVRDIDGVPVHEVARLSDLVWTENGPARVVLADTDGAEAVLYEQLTHLAESGVEIVSMASVYEHVTGRIPVRHLGNYWWAALPRPSGNLVYQVSKRAIDVCGALAGLLVLGLVLPFVAWPLMREAGGTLFFSQIRLGHFGRPIRVVKLRTLPVARSSADAHSASFWERKKANRPSKLGAILRATGIDELPQCWNVLRGEMSLVGPRPYVPEEVDSYQQDIPFFRSRALVKPGITGWAQLNWGYGFSLNDEVEKLQYDLYYVGHQSFYLDLVIMLGTLRLLLNRRRRLPTTQAAPARREALVRL